jgi:arylsulfatase
MTNQGFDYANFSMYNQFPNMIWHEFMGPSGAVQGLFESQWDRKYTLDKNFRPLGYVNQLEGRKGENPRVFTGTTLGDYKKMLRTHQQIVIDYLDEAASSDKPFYLAYWPHVYDLVRKPEELTTSASTPFAQSVVELDRDIGQIMDKLQELGLAENTLVIAMADNGPMHELAPMGPHEIIVRGGKGDYLEGGIRVPAFAWWPGVIDEDQVVGDMIRVLDLFTTFISLAPAHLYRRYPGGVHQTAVQAYLDW